MPCEQPSAPNLQKRRTERLYGRKQDRPLRSNQERLMREVLPTVAAPAAPTAPFDPRQLFDDVAHVEMEIGFGGGENLIALAAARPDVGFIGAEPFVNGIVKALAEIEARGLSNIRLLHADARPFLRALKPGALQRLFVLYPDPWPKTRHHKRRIIQPDFLDAAARAIAPGGELRVASDIPGYIRWTLQHMAGRKDFDWRAEAPADWRTRPADQVETRYEQKAKREGRTPAYLVFSRQGAEDREKELTSL